MFSLHWIINNEINVFYYQETLYLMSTKDDVYSVKIITRKHWVLVGTHDGFILVYEYETGMKLITRFKGIYSFY
jgi:hypothetical protein